MYINFKKIKSFLLMFHLHMSMTDSINNMYKWRRCYAEMNYCLFINGPKVLGVLNNLVRILIRLSNN